MHNENTVLYSCSIIGNLCVDDVSRFMCAEDAGGNSGEDIQLTTTITHVDGPSEIYKMAGKEAQE